MSKDRYNNTGGRTTLSHYVRESKLIQHGIASWDSLLFAALIASNNGKSLQHSVRIRWTIKIKCQRNKINKGNVIIRSISKGVRCSFRQSSTEKGKKSLGAGPASCRVMRLPWSSSSVIFLGLSFPWSYFISCLVPLCGTLSTFPFVSSDVPRSDLAHSSYDEK